METILISLKVLFYSILGYYIESAVSDRAKIFNGPIFLFYGLFGILAVYSEKLPIVYLFILGATWGILLNTLLETINDRLKTRLNYKFLGLLHVLNVLLLEDFFDWFIVNSSYQSITFLFIVGISLFIIDVATSLRRLI